MLVQSRWSSRRKNDLDLNRPALTMGRLAEGKIFFSLRHQNTSHLTYCVTVAYPLVNSYQFKESAMDQDNITVKKSAELLHVTPHYIRKLLREGKIEGDQNAETSRWSVKKSSLEAFRSSDLYKQDINSLAKEMRISIKEAVEDVEELFECDLISYISFPGTPVSFIDYNDSILLDDLLYNLKETYKAGQNGKKFHRIGLFLHSGGGILEAAIKFVDIIRQYSDEFIVIVPLMAKSAATAITLMSDKQYFTTLSELGPVDPMVQSPSNPSMIVPATAIDNFLEYYRQKSQASSGTNHAPENLDPIIAEKLEKNLDPFLLGAHKTALKFSTETIEQSLRNGVMRGKDEQLIKQAVEEFTVKHNSHGFPITLTTLEQFGIGEKITDEKLQAVKLLMGVYQQFMVNSNIVKLVGNREENKNITVMPVNQTQQVPTRTSL